MLSGTYSLCSGAGDRRVLHAPLVMRGVERGRPVDQHDRDHVLETDVWNLTIVHDGPDGRGKANDDGLYIVGVERALPSDVLDGVERRLNRSADGPLLDIGVDDFVPVAKLVDQSAGSPFGALT